MAVDAKALYARIAALERENGELREQNESLLFKQKLSPQLPRQSSSKASPSRSRRKLLTEEVTFDGYKTRLNLGQDVIQLPEDNPIEGHAISRMSTISWVSEGCDGDIDDGQEESLQKNKHDFRRASMLGNTMRSALTLSSDGSKVYGFREDNGVRFTLGQKKTNRYAKLVDEMLRMSVKKEEDDSNQPPVMADARGDDSDGCQLIKSKSESDLEMGTLELPRKHKENTSGQRIHDQHTQSNPDPKVKAADIEKILVKLRRSNSTCEMVLMQSTSISSLSGTDDLSFHQFMLLSINPAADRDTIKWTQGGPNYLDPFILKSPDCVDKYPPFHDDFAPEELSPFCCHDGIRIRLVPAVAAAETILNSLGWNDDQYKVLVFTNAGGRTTHGVAVTVATQMPANHRHTKKLIRELQALRNNRYFARVLQRWWRSCMRANKEKMPIISECQPSSKGKSKIATRISRKTTKRTKKSLTGSLKVSATDSLSLMKKKFTNKGRAKSNPYEFSERNDSTIPIQGQHTNNGCHASEHNRDEVSESAKRLGKESFETMESAHEMGDCCIVERCYVLIGGKESEQILQLRSLQHLADLENTVRSTNNCPCGFGYVDNGAYFPFISHTLVKDPWFESVKERHDYLDEIQMTMCLSPDKARIKLPEDDFQILTQTPSMFEIDLPSFGIAKPEKIHVQLPLPQIAGHFGIATILQKLNPSDLLSVLNLLLIERSILVVGESTDIVTSCASVLLKLLHPFQWASNFVPLLPFDMLDFVNSPVPFMIGMTTTTSHGNRIVEDTRVKEALGDGLSVIDLDSGVLHLTTEPGIESLVQQCQSSNCKSKLSQYKLRLEELRNEGSALGASLSVFLKEEISQQEVIVLKSLHSCIQEYVFEFGSGAKAWQQFGKRGKDSFDFYPSLLIDNLRKRSEALLRFQEMMFHSQLFIEYVDQAHKKDAERDAKRATASVFISTWIYIKLKRHKAQKASKKT